MSLDEALEGARAQLRSGDARAAFQTLHATLRYPAPDLRDREPFGRAMGLFAEIASAIGGPQLGATVGVAGARPDDANALFQAGYALFEQGLTSVAATALDRANRLAPGQAPIVAELATCLESELLSPDAARLVDGSGLADSDDLCAYLSGFHNLMSGDLDVPRRRVLQLSRSHDPNVIFARDALAAMLARADALQAAGVATDERALTAWHAVIDGAVLLHESPHGYDAGMNGRYAFVGDSPSLMREGIERLAAVLEATDRIPSRVIAAPDRASVVLATAVASRLKVPLEHWAQGDVRPGLVVAWSLDAVGDPRFYVHEQEHLPERLLFAHASPWVTPFAYAPDFTTLLYQHVTHPWMGGAMRMDPETKAVAAVPPDERDVGTLAAEITNAAALRDGEGSRSDLADVVRVATALRATGLSTDVGPRPRARAGSPVRSSRFS